MRIHAEGFNPVMWDIGRRKRRSSEDETRCVTISNHDTVLNIGF
jgi:hypothetical protein